MTAKFDSILGEMREHDSLSPGQAERLDSIREIQESSSESLEASPGDYWSWTVADETDATVTFNSTGLTGKSAFAWLDIYLGVAASITGEEVTIVDELEDGLLNRCLIHWDGREARLYVVEIQEVADEQL